MTFKDRHVRTCLWLCLCTPALTIALLATPVGTTYVFLMTAMPVLLTLWMAAGLGVLVGLVAAARRRDWRRACALFLVVALVGAALSDRTLLIRRAYIVGGALNLAVMEPTYRARISRMARSDQDLVVLNRGLIEELSMGIIYDQSDQIRLPRGQRSLEWEKRASERTICAPQAALLWRHFYAASFSCPG